MENSQAARRAVTAALLSQLRQPHEFNRLLLLIIVWARARQEDPFFDLDGPAVKGASPATPRRAPKGKGYHVKRPRTRFL